MNIGTFLASDFNRKFDWKITQTSVKNSTRPNRNCLLKAERFICLVTECLEIDQEIDVDLFTVEGQQYLGVSIFDLSLEKNLMFVINNTHPNGKLLIDDPKNFKDAAKQWHEITWKQILATWPLKK